MEEFKTGEDKRREFVEGLQDLKIDLEELSSRLLGYRQSFYNCLEHELQQIKNHERSNSENHISKDDEGGEDNFYTKLNHPYTDIMTLVNSMLSSYLAPAYHFNNYIDAVARDITWDDIKYNLDTSQWISNVNRKASYQIEVQAIFFSIKMALDRLVAIFTYYYKGLSVDSTFGRYKKSEKKEGLMGIARKQKESDQLLQYIDKEYHKWIKAAVEPRDIITHYNDLGINYYFDSEVSAIIPIHVNDRLIQNKKEESTSTSYNFMQLDDFITLFYDFYENVINSLLSKSLVVSQGRI
ncbi:hypothetical protein ACIG6B_07355 [Bacillus mobilis]|uniref:hypothetical protein n=2 Tax=Bacillus mobilis TaxID=2026190 RepID=UPI00362F3085